MVGLETRRLSFVSLFLVGLETPILVRLRDVGPFSGSDGEAGALDGGIEE